MVRLSRILWFAAVALLFAAGGCRSRFDDHRDALRRLVAQGRWEEAAASLDRPGTRDLYGARNELLWLFDRGSVAQAMGDSATAVEALNRAEDIIDRKRGEDVGDVLGALLVNDTLRRYTGEPYEDIYLNVLKMLAHLEAGTVSGGATVEARRIATKANLLRDRFLTLYPAARGKALREVRDAARGDSLSVSEGFIPAWELDGPAQGTAAAREVAENEQGQFIESTLGLYLTSVVWMVEGDPGNQRVAAERLAQTIEAHGPFMRGVRAEAFEDLATRTTADGNVLVVALSGLGPRKYALRLPPIIIDSAPIYFELPVVRETPSAAAGARVIVSGESERAMALVEDLGQVAAENHRRQLPLTYLRTIARAAVKALATREAIKEFEKKNNDPWVRLGVNLGGLLVPGLTERADTRAWETLPGRAHVALLDLPPGEHWVRVEWLSGSGFVVDESAVFRVRVEREGEFRAVVARSPR
jgi:hypothetical protein